MTEKKVETRKIILKKGEPRTKRTIGTSTVTADPGKPVEVPLAELTMWLKTGKFEEYTPKEKAAGGGQNVTAEKDGGKK